MKNKLLLVNLFAVAAMFGSHLAAACPPLPVDYEDNEHESSTTQDERLNVAKHFACHFELRIMVSNHLKAKGFEIKIVDPKGRLSTLTEARSSGDFSEIFPNGLPRFFEIESTIRNGSWGGNEDGYAAMIVVSAPPIPDSPLQTATAKKLIIQGKYQEHEVELDKIEAVRTCLEGEYSNNLNNGDPYNLRGHLEFKPRKGGAGWFHKIFTLPECSHVLVATNSIASALPEDILEMTGHARCPFNIGRFSMIKKCMSLYDVFALTAGVSDESLSVDIRNEQRADLAEKVEFGDAPQSALAEFDLKDQEIDQLYERTLIEESFATWEIIPELRKAGIELSIQAP